MSRAYYSDFITGFIKDDLNRILGHLATRNQFALEDLQRNAWINEIVLLQSGLGAFEDGYILFEYSIPRMGRRVDVVILRNGIVFVIEFKIGSTTYAAEALDQVMDYALDLKNFHEQSHNSPIIPILVATQAVAEENVFSSYADQVFNPLKANRHNIGEVIQMVCQEMPEKPMDYLQWENSIYKPTPTIIEAAQALYSGHGVKEISRSDAGAVNLSFTSDAVFRIIDYTRENQHKAICFITGVPGAGKTLAGLNIANERLQYNESEHAVFLSGNGPLVKVLREALIRDELESQNKTRGGLTRLQVASKVQTFIQNIHHFRDEALNSKEPPLEKIAIFDEAQRAWTAHQASLFMMKKRGVPDFAMSEPRFLISIMDRHPDWAVIVCLVGGGQEINTGEAGISEWFTALNTYFPHWRVYVSPNLPEEEYVIGLGVSESNNSDQLYIDPRLHLAVSIRSFRAENLSDLVKAVLDVEVDQAKTLLKTLANEYPIVVTRDLDKARDWLKTQARGSERYGLLASSGGYRLRPLGINIQANINVVNWFLNSKDDVRSSYFLEEVATEFDIQGLELDWTGIVWDADFRFSDQSWKYHSFRGTKWRNVKDSLRRRYLKNAYRVLLTRARQGMVIVVPRGSDEDLTRKSEYYDGTYDYLANIGFKVI